jgi:hypothetical protein
LLASIAGISTAEPIAPGGVEIIDGDTIRTHGRTIRLVGFDAPESGFRARCESERTLAAKATFRLRQLVSGGGSDLELIPCSCRPGTEGTPRCNSGPWRLAWLKGTSNQLVPRVVPARLCAPQLRHHPYASTSQSSRKNNKRTLLGALHEFELLDGWVVVGR